MKWRELFHGAEREGGGREGEREGKGERSSSNGDDGSVSKFIYSENIVPSVTRNRPRKYIDARCYKLTTRIIIVLNSARMAGGKSDRMASSLKAAA